MSPFLLSEEFLIALSVFPSFGQRIFFLHAALGEVIVLGFSEHSPHDAGQ